MVAKAMTEVRKPGATAKGQTCPIFFNSKLKRLVIDAFSIFWHTSLLPETLKLV